MISGGIIKLIGICVIILASNTWLGLVFNLDNQSLTNMVTNATSIAMITKNSTTLN